jgi:hypothetical protein
VEPAIRDSIVSGSIPVTSAALDAVQNLLMPSKVSAKKSVLNPRQLEIMNSLSRPVEVIHGKTFLC